MACQSTANGKIERYKRCIYELSSKTGEKLVNYKGVHPKAIGQKASVVCLKTVATSETLSAVCCNIVGRPFQTHRSLLYDHHLLLFIVNCIYRRVSDRYGIDKIVD